MVFQYGHDYKCLWFFQGPRWSTESDEVQEWNFIVWKLILKINRVVFFFRIYTWFDSWKCLHLTFRIWFLHTFFDPEDKFCTWRLWFLLWQSFWRIFPSGSDSKESACNAGDLGLIPGSGRSSGEGNGGSLQYSCLENPMDRGAWWGRVHGISKSQTQLKWLSKNWFRTPGLEKTYV